MYISVIPLRYSLSKRPYIYLVPDIWKNAVEEGFLVEIPLWKHIVIGIIASIHIEPDCTVSPEDIRPIVQVIAWVEIVSPYMIRMIEEIADTYFLQIHKVAWLFLPAPLLGRLDKKNYLIAENNTPDKKSFMKEWWEKAIDIDHYIDEVFTADMIDWYFWSKSIFIFPDETLLSLFYEKIPKETQAKIGIYSPNLTPAKRVRIWIDIYNGKYDIIFWTRKILYYNLQAYDSIIYLEDSFGTEQYTYPIKIHNLDILSALQKTGYHSVKIISSTLSLKTLSYFPKKNIVSIRRSHDSWNTQ